MKTKLMTALFCAWALAGHAEEQNDDLMKRMGFSAQEIASSRQTHSATIKGLDGIGPKQTENATSLSQAQGILDLRSIRKIRYQAIQAAKAAEKEAQDAAARAEEAEQKARTARNYATWAAGNSGISGVVFSQALIGRDQLWDAAHAARQEANAKEREAADVAEQSQKIIARADAQEAVLKSKGIDE